MLVAVEVAVEVESSFEGVETVVEVVVGATWFNNVSVICSGIIGEGVLK